MKSVDIFTDGACSGNPGPGGWGVVLRFGEHEKELSGGEKNTTNNRMELTAAIMGLSALKEQCKVRLVTDSKYVADGITKGWAESWKKNGWRKADKSQVLNDDLWKKLDALLQKYETEFIWVRGHDGHAYNERCDALASGFAESIN